MVEELETNTKYEFRVTAVNRVGKSDASDPTAPQLIKAQKAPPKIDRKVLKEEMIFKVGKKRYSISQALVLCALFCPNGKCSLFLELTRRLLQMPQDVTNNHED